MKLNKKISDYIKLGSDHSSRAGGILTVILFFTTYGARTYNAALNATKSALNFFYPDIPPTYQVVNSIVWIVIITLYISVYILTYKVLKKLFAKFIEGLAIHLILEINETTIPLTLSGYDKILQQELKPIEEKIDELQKLVTPLAPISRVTGTNCPLPGVYMIQEKIFNGVEKTFTLNQPFPPYQHPLTNKEVMVTWVYQHPLEKNKPDQ